MDCLSISRPSDNGKIFFSKDFRFFRKNAVFIRSGECKKYLENRSNRKIILGRKAKE